MPNRSNPIPGRYYINLTGQLIKVRALLYVGDDTRRVALEYLDGRRLYVASAEWEGLDLAYYSDWAAGGGATGEIEREG